MSVIARVERGVAPVTYKHNSYCGGRGLAGLADLADLTDLAGLPRTFSLRLATIVRFHTPQCSLSWTHIQTH